ncbi:hypothetical protein PQR67_05950 [Paraburkholderia fungorum]|uniref:hypothetical protein n=1 Tax=Paraburkholderia fungorum TaxID=134537 RepID=UPI0038B830FD
MPHVLGFHSYYREGERITENFPLFHHLMNGAMSGCRKCCTARFLFSHFTPDGYHASQVRKAKALARYPVLSRSICSTGVCDSFDSIIDRPFLAARGPWNCLGQRGHRRRETTAKLTAIAPV